MENPEVRIVTSAKGKNRRRWWRNDNVSDWSSLCEWLRGIGDGGKADRPYVPATFKHDPARRKNEFIVEKYALTLDADKAGSDYLARVAAVLKCLALSHTTYSHTADDPRYRTIVPVSRPMTPVEAKSLATYLVELIGRERFDVQASVSPVAVAYAHRLGRCRVRRS